MSKEPEGANGAPQPPSVEELRSRLEANQEDLPLRLDLANALLDRYIFGEGAHRAADEADIAHLKELLGTLPADKALFARAYLDYHANRTQAFVRSSLKWLSCLGQPAGPPLDCDELVELLILPFDPERLPDGLLGQWADTLNHAWPNSPAVLTLRALAEAQQGKPGAAIDSLVLALDKDPAYWIAAWDCGGLYGDQRNWQSALAYYMKALARPSAQSLPALQFDTAWCLHRLKRYQEAAQHYQLCLELDPDWPNARNNLGVTLLEQKRYEEALDVLDEAIRRGNDGRRPLQNKARVLAKLGRYEESIEAWRHAGPRSKLPKWIESQIAGVRKTAERAKRGQLIEEGSLYAVPLAESERSSAVAEEEPFASAVSERRRAPTPVRTEQTLEEMIEQRIQSGQEVFGRKLRMYNVPADYYGRQYPIPALGRIDLLAEDTETGNLVVIELKRGEGHQEVVGQISLYMTWVRENRAGKDRKVVGIICLNKASEKLLLAARNVEGLEVRGYDMAFPKL